MYRSAVQSSTINVTWEVFFLFTLDALLICSSHYTQLMSFSWTNACNFTRNITSTACNNMRVITRIFLYLCVWYMDVHCV